jgi:hypothetical protein
VPLILKIYWINVRDVTLAEDVRRPGVIILFEPSIYYGVRLLGCGELSSIEMVHLYFSRAAFKSHFASKIQQKLGINGGYSHPKLLSLNYQPVHVARL